MTCTLSQSCPLSDCIHRNGKGKRFKGDAWFKAEFECNSYRRAETIDDYIEQRNDEGRERFKEMTGH